MDDEKKERIKKIEEEISFYHEKAGIQNSQIQKSLESREIINKAIKWGMIIWSFVIVCTIVLISKNFEYIKLLSFKDIAFDAFNIAVGSFLFSDGLAFIGVSLFKPSDYSKTKILFFSVILLLFSIVLISNGVIHIKELIGGVSIGP